MATVVGTPGATPGGMGAGAPHESPEVAPSDRQDAREGRESATTRLRALPSSRTLFPAWLLPSRSPCLVRVAPASEYREVKAEGRAERGPGPGLVPFTTTHTTRQLQGAGEKGLSPFLKTRIPYTGSYQMRGRWMQPGYTGLRNAAWAVRNARVANDQNPLALKLVLAEAERLLQQGEPMWDVLEAFAELLQRP